MNKIIQDIIDKYASNEEKHKELDLLVDDIMLARKVLNGEFKYCSICKDYYLSQSFMTKYETKETEICTYQDPINSGWNEYTSGYADITYIICPKGHKKEINRKERFK